METKVKEHLELLENNLEKIEYEIMCKEKIHKDIFDKHLFKLRRTIADLYNDYDAVEHEIKDYKRENGIHTCNFYNHDCQTCREEWTEFKEWKKSNKGDIK